MNKNERTGFMALVDGSIGKKKETLKKNKYSRGSAKEEGELSKKTEEGEGTGESRYARDVRR